VQGAYKTLEICVMTRLRTKFVMGVAAAVLLSACQVQKSANPLSPQVAGPIAGVEISSPALLEPGQDWELRTRDQPIKLLFQNANSNGERPLTYAFELAADAAFKNVVFARTGVQPDPGPETRFQLPDRLAAGTYWWRTRAEDGANASPYSAVKSFNVLAEVVLAPPIPSTPKNGALLSDITPDFRVKAGARSGVTDDLEYIVQISNNSSFTSIAAIFTTKESWPETHIDNGYSFLHDRTYYWRVRAWHTADGSEFSNWSATQTFKTPKPPADPPPPPPGDDDDGGGGGGTNPNSCNSSAGKDIAECIQARYPAYLAAGVSLDARKRNMQFLRDRMIEHAKCRGLDVGQNLKRGGPEISNDFVAWKNGGRLEGVDIASSYDDTGKRLNLMWHTYGPPDYGFPYYKFYAHSCN
jgi:hypothetical protein